jgi:hypothetical protein
MAFRGTFKIKNPKTGSKVKVGTSHNNLSPAPSQPSGPAQYLIINNTEYLITKSGSQHKFFGEPSWNGFNNKTVDVEGVFVGNMIMVSSITKVGN